MKIKLLSSSFFFIILIYVNFYQYLAHYSVEAESLI